MAPETPAARLRRYGLVLAAVLAVVGLRLLINTLLLPEPSFFLFPLTVFLVSWRLGLGPGLWAAAALAAAGWLFFLDPRLSLGQRAGQTAVFVLQAAFTSAVAWYLARLHRARLRADQRATTLLDNISDGFFTLDGQWRFTSCNRHVREAYGGGRELTGKNIWEVFPQLASSVYEESYRRSMEERTPVQFEAQSRISNRWFRTYVYPFEDGIAVFTAEITELRMAEEEMRKAKEAAERQAREAQEAKAQSEEASRMKDQFLATLSHELRTPLNAILGWTQILRSGRMDEAGMRRGLDVIERSSRAQAQLIDDLLDVSRITSGKLRIEMRPVDLPDVIDAALATVAPAADAKGIALEKSYAPLPAPVSGDPERLQQVVWNLLSNAVKFTPRGGRVEVSLRPVDASAEIRVADTGQGIRPDFLPFVFDAFRQADSSTTRRQGGLGLGLSIVRQMVEMHGGTVQVESEGEGRGAAFIVTLPLALETAPRLGRAEVFRGGLDGVRADSLHGLRLLVVDDDLDARELLRQILGGCGAQVTLAASAHEALKALDAGPPDILVSDIGMPGRDGFELIRDVRSRWAADALPAIALTAFARAEDRRRILEAGFQAHLVKPVDVAELTAAVAQLRR